jgi:DNA-directed RNA polymerase subunit RPC12/RpoP
MAGKFQHIKPIVFEVIKQLESKIRGFKPCVVCGREWTLRSIDRNGVCPDCREIIYCRRMNKVLRKK